MQNIIPFLETNQIFTLFFSLPDMVVLLLLSLLGGLFGILGGVFFLYHKKSSTLLERYSVPFAAGAMITVALIALLPEATHMIGESAFIVMLISFFGSFFFEQFVFSTHHHSHDHLHEHDDCKHTQNIHDSHSVIQGEGRKEIKSSSTMLVIVGDTIHNFVDGVAIGAAFVVNPLLGFVTAISSLLHELPHEIGDFGILLNAGWQKKNIILVNAVSALATILGAFGVLLISQDPTVIGTLLALSAGIFFYLGAIDFIPHSFHTTAQNKRSSFVALLLGVVILFAALSALPHEHDHGHEHDHEHESHQSHESYGSHGHADQEDDHGHEDETERYADKDHQDEKGKHSDDHDHHDENEHHHEDEHHDEEDHHDEDHDGKR